MAQPVEAFIVCSKEDERLRQEFLQHVSFLEQLGIRPFSDCDIAPGLDWEGEALGRLGSARLLLLLVSASFAASPWFTERTRLALSRHRCGDAVVLSILLRECLWRETDLATLPVLPSNGIAVQSWDDRDQAWADVARGVQAALHKLGAAAKRVGTVPLVLIPAGEFNLGSAESKFSSHERPQRRVALSSFWISPTPITAGDYTMFNDVGPPTTAPAQFSALDHPVVGVCWSRAAQFCNVLSRREGLSPAYATGTGDLLTGMTGYRLPTEAQWEYACRAGSAHAWCFGDDRGRLDEFAWYGDRPTCFTHPVGRKLPNAWGLHDMHGNVWEWCHDWYGPYGGCENDPSGPPHGSVRVVRGGSTSSPADWTRSAYRDFRLPRYRCRDLGFRVVRPAHAGET